jgi:hypothetical protein
MPDITGLKDLSQMDMILPRSKLKKEIEGGWRMDISFTVEDELDDAVEIDVEVDKSMSENNEK